MSFSEAYRKQAALVLRALPEVEGQESFALKGGTGINLFIRDMPRGYEEMSGLLLFYSRR
jgi:hypothetical protein